MLVAPEFYFHVLNQAHNIDESIIQKTKFYHVIKLQKIQTEKNNSYKIFHCVCYTHSKSTHDDSQSKSSEQDSIYWQLESNKHPQEKYVGSPLVKCCVEGIYSQSTLLIPEGRQGKNILFSFLFLSSPSACGQVELLRTQIGRPEMGWFSSRWILCVTYGRECKNFVILYSAFAF